MRKVMFALAILAGAVGPASAQYSRNVGRDHGQWDYYGLQDNPLVRLVSRNGLRQMAYTRRKVHLFAQRHVGELPVAAAHGGASQKVIAVHAVLDGSTA